MENKWAPLEMAIEEEDTVTTDGQPSLVTRWKNRVMKGQWVTWDLEECPLGVRPNITKGLVLTNENLDDTIHDFRVRFPTSKVIADRHIVSPCDPPTKAELIDMMLDMAQTNWWGELITLGEEEPKPVPKFATNCPKCDFPKLAMQNLANEPTYFCLNENCGHIFGGPPIT